MPGPAPWPGSTVTSPAGPRADGGGAAASRATGLRTERPGDPHPCGRAAATVAAVRVDGPIGRVVQRVSASPAFARVAPRVITPLDRFVHRVTGGRRMLSGGVVDTLVLTTTGARSGEPRSVPLACFPDGESFYVVGSNFGRERHPAWTANLLRTPTAHVAFEGRTVDVDAHLLSPEEKAAVWPRLLAAWPNYRVYTERSGRDLRVFRLDPR